MNNGSLTTLDNRLSDVQTLTKIPTFSSNSYSSNVAKRFETKTYNHPNYTVTATQSLYAKETISKSYSCKVPQFDNKEIDRMNDLYKNQVYLPPYVPKQVPSVTIKPLPQLYDFPCNQGMKYL